MLALRNLPGSIHFLLHETAKQCDADYVIIDMSPSLGPLNQNLLVTSDYFIVPLHPDYFSGMALSSLAKVLPRWKAWADTAFGIEMLTKADYPFPKPNPKYIGAIIQKYRPRNGRASKAFQRWIDALVSDLEKILVPALVKAKMLDTEEFKERSDIEPWTPLLEVSDFNSLIAISQEHQVPIYSITANQAEQQGAVWEQTKYNMGEFRKAFANCADKVIALTE